ncbi:NusB antitermination factor [Desulfonatronospira thiodismutans ASO3-1]|uniref:Transcription antitermination protein NusB n=1 Tax=Desulfonatronospira thiodismutans ASO3-1 TaxID=555779 RepID=D6SQQ8_9BACT|nr:MULTISPECIES: transcription antitermination factor NusB [Desulfonatronospira]EFI35084.1 NusB antitermination factor [Desulfonatronospira thiodismutans ASO3-1]RQD73537.1 MAG: transcription antitermination factor NusB [Desulfonatronospira sp. MSAO_Bac3]
MTRHKPRTKTTHSRHAQREFAFQVLYSLHFDQTGTHILDTFHHFKNDQDTAVQQDMSYALQLINGVRENLEELDAAIGRHSQNWKVKRIAMVELTIMRLAVYEMIYREDIPVKVGINEAIELAKTFGDNNSRNFVNGILDAVARDMRHGEPGTDAGA